MSSGAKKYDVVVIGGGHNGLTTAAFLGKRGRKVLVLERRAVLGGLASGGEFHAGYRSAGILDDTAALRRGLVAELGLERFGLRFEKEPAPVLALQKGGSGNGILLAHNPAKNGSELSAHDAKRYAEYRAFFSRVGNLVRDVFSETPPNIINPTMGELFSLGKKGLTLKLMGKKDMLEVLRIGPMCVADWLNEWFESELLKSCLAAPALFASCTGPWSGGTTANLIMHEALSAAPVEGGSPALVKSLADCAASYGVEIRTGAAVQEIQVSSGSARGVVLADGEVIAAKVIASSLDPHTTFLALISAQEISHQLEERVKNVRARGTTAKIHLALNTVPRFACRPQTVVAHARAGETLDDLERSFDASKYRRFSDRPMLDIRLPSVTNPELAPSGHAVMSVLVHFAPYRLDAGWSDATRDELGQRVINVISDYIPGFQDMIVGGEILVPPDIESRYGTFGGHLFHGEQALDQLLARPFPEAAQYRTPLGGLFLCGSGSHPGGGITCGPGALAAKAILATDIS